MRILSIAVALSLVATIATPASAQDEPSGEAPSLTVELERDPTQGPAPDPVPILEPIGPTRRAQPASAAQRDVPFTMPNDAQDARIQGQGLELPPEEPPPPPIFGVAVGAGWTRMLANIALDYIRLEQRFEARIPDFLGLFVGVGVAELFDPSSIGGYLIEVGPRVGFGAGFCDDRLVSCEGVVYVQPGVAVGELVGVQFDFQGALDLRFLFARLVELSAGAAVSFIDRVTFVSVSGNVGLRF